MKLSAVFVVFASFLDCSTGLASVDVERPYYSRNEPTVFTTQPKDGVLSGATPMNISCEATVKPIVSGWYPHIYWYHNGSIVNSSHGIAIESNHWNRSHLTTVYPGSYQCVLDDGYFVTVSREAQISLDTTQSDTYTIDFKESSNAFSRLNVDDVHPKRTLLCPEMTTPSGIAWFHNGRRMNSSKSTINITAPEGSHAENVIGVYQCFVFNSTHEFSQTYKVELHQRPNPPGRVTVQGEPFPSLGLVKYTIGWNIDVNLQNLRLTFLIEVSQSGNFSKKCKISAQIKNPVNYVAYLLWPDTVREYRIVTTTDRECRSDPSLCSPLLSNVGNVTKIPSTYQDDMTVNGCKNGSCLQDYDYCKLSYDKRWTERFSSSCELYEDQDLTCTLVWLATEPVDDPDDNIRKSIVSCQNELMESVSLKSRHNTRYIFTMEVEDIPCNSLCLFSIKYPDRRGYHYTNESYHFQSPKIAPKFPENLVWNWEVENFSSLAECMDSVSVIVDMNFTHSSCGNPENFSLCANSSNGYDYKCISMNWKSKKFFTNSTTVIHYHLEANWYGLKNSIHEPSSIAVVFSNTVGNTSIVLEDFLEKEVPKFPMNLAWNWKVENYSRQAECMDSVSIIVDMNFTHSSCGNPENFSLCANSSNGYDYKCISMNWKSKKFFTNSTTVIHYHLEANWYGLKNSIHEPSTIAVVFSNTVGNTSIILEDFLEKEAATLCPPEQTEAPTTATLIKLTTITMAAILLSIILSFVVVMLLLYMRHRSRYTDTSAKRIQ